MKTNNFILAILLFFSFFAAYAQQSPKIIAIVTKANWCPTCVNNESRIGSDVIPKIDTNQINLIINDLTNAKTKEVSLQKLKESGLQDLNLKVTGLITFVDPTTKKIVSSIKVTESTDTLLASFSSYNK